MKHLSFLARALLLLVSHCVMASAFASGAGDAQAGRKALASFESMLRAMESGDVWTLRASFNVAMIGYQNVLDNIANDSNQCKQLRVNLQDTQVQPGPDRVVLQTGWEKRCLLLPNFSPVLVKGRSTVTMRRSGDGWRLVSISAGNMFDRMVAQPTVVRTQSVPVATKPAASLVANPAATSIAPGTAVPTTCTIHGRPANCALVHYAPNCTRTGTSVACP